MTKATARSMAEQTAIEWADKTWSPWIGCTKVSPGCMNCYAERENNRRKWTPGFGKNIPRMRTSERYWQQPERWDKEAFERGVRYRVFPSLCDIFDPEVPAQWREDFFTMVYRHMSLDWLILTKRPMQALEFFGPNSCDIYPNLWLGVSAENQQTYSDRLDIIAELRPAVRWVSIEPLIGPIIPWCIHIFDWVVIGGESDPVHPRPCRLEWVHHIIDECRRFDVPVFFKQWGGKSKIDGHWGGNLVDGKVIQEFPCRS